MNRLFLSFCLSHRYGWQTYFIQNYTTNTNGTVQKTILTNLTQHTQYAYYVKTQVVPIDNEELLNLTSQGQSNIEYFKTKADVPTQPFVQTYSKSHDSLTLIWQPFFDNELIEYYRMDYFIQPDDPAVLDARDYCKNPRVEINTAIEANEQHPFPDAKLSCKAQYEHWRLRNLDVPDPENAWRRYRKAECAAHPTQNGESTMQATKYIENYPLNLCDLLGGGKCALQSDFESLRFSRQIHNFIMTSHGSDSTNRNLMNQMNEEPNFGVNYMGRMEFPNSVQKTTINGLKPYTMYIFQFFSCLSTKNCSGYFLYYDRTDALATADNVELTVTTDSYDTNRVHLDFNEAKQPNGLTVAFEVEKHDLSNFKVTVFCITRKQHYDNGNR